MNMAVTNTVDKKFHLAIVVVAPVVSRWR